MRKPVMGLSVALAMVVMGLSCTDAAVKGQTDGEKASPEAAVSVEPAADPAAEAPAATATAADAVLKTTKEKVSYCIGANIGRNLARQMIEIDADALTRGLADATAEPMKMLMTEDQMRVVMQAFDTEMKAKMQKRMGEMAAKNRAAGEIFLAANAKKEGVVTLPSGLQYKVITEGSGETPKATDTVTTHYRGTLIDGTEFDSSYTREQPATFAVRGVIPGWVEALQLMTVGSKWQLFVPGKLAYGERGRAPRIEPNATLVFELELLSIGSPKPPAVTPPATTP